jgi:ribosomal protein S16
VGEAAYLSGGIAAVIPGVTTAARWSAEKAVAGLEQGMQGLRALGFRAADAGLDVASDAAGMVARNADDIAGGIGAGVRGAAGVIDDAAGGIVSRADDIGGAIEGAGKKIGDLSDEHLLPRIREGLTQQTGRPDIIDDVFRAGEEGRTLRKQLGTETLTGTREVHAEKLGEALNAIHKQALDNMPMFDDLGLAMKKDLQAIELAGSNMSRKQQLDLAKNIAEEAGKTFEQLGKYNPTARTFFKDAIDEFIEKSLKSPSPEAIYQGLDRLKVATDKIAKWSQGAQLGDTGAAFAAEEARRFRSFAKNLLEDAETWGAAGVLQQEGNALYSRVRRAYDQFEKQFAAPKAKGQHASVLDGAKIKKFAKDITGQPGEVRNAVIDELVEAQQAMIAWTEKVAKRANAPGVGTTPAVAGTVRKPSVDPGVLDDALGRGKGAADDLAKTKAAALKDIDRAEVLQQTQNAILSRQGAGVNPLPVELAQKIGGGALVGGAIGGIPGAIVGGSITSVLQKYGAVTTNPKSAIELLNTIDKLRGANKESIASWLKQTLGESTEQGLRGKLSGLASKVDDKKLADAIRSRAKGAQEAIDRFPASSIETKTELFSARGALDNANKTTAKKLLAARRSAEGGIASFGARIEGSTPSTLRRLLPAVSYAGVEDADPDLWWQRTSKGITGLQANPQKLIDQMEKDTEAIAGVLPDQARAIQEQTIRVLSYLADRMPKNPRPYMLGQPDWKPTRSELKAYQDMVLVATKPDALLPLITMGTATSEQVETVRTLWPSKFAEMKAQIVNAVTTAAAEGRPVPYKSRIRLGTLLGVPLDPSQEPGFAQWIDENTGGAQLQEKEPGGIKGQLDLDPDKDLPFSAKTMNRK